MFRKILAVLLSLLLIAGTALADDHFTLWGYENESVGCDWETNLFFKRMEEKTGISFTFREITAPEAWSQLKADMTAEGELPDVLFKANLSDAETQKLYADGVIIDLKPYLEEYAPHLWAQLQENPSYLTAITMPDGTIPALPEINRLQYNNAMWINTTWLETLKLEVPTTAEELKKVLIAFRDKDPNRNNKSDEVPLSFLSMWDLKFLSHAFGFVMNDYGLTTDADGQVVDAITTDANRALLTWLHELWAEKLLYRDGFSTGDSLRQITDSKAAMIYGMMFAPSPLSLVPSASIDQYDVLMPMKCNGEAIYRDLLSDLIRGTFAITSACAEPEKLVAWVDFLYTEEGSRLAQAGLENVEYRFRSDGTWEWIDDMEKVAEHVLPGVTVAQGSALPGMVSSEFQLAYYDSTTHKAVEQLAAMRDVAVAPVPSVVMDEAHSTEIAQIQYELGAYAEQMMTWFVTGEAELTDENWQTFCDTVYEKGMARMVTLWNETVNR